MGGIPAYFIKLRFDEECRKQFCEIDIFMAEEMGEVLRQRQAQLLVQAEVGLIGVDHQHLESARRIGAGQQRRDGAFAAAAFSAENQLHWSFLLSRDLSWHNHSTKRLSRKVFFTQSSRSARFLSALRD